MKIPQITWAQNQKTIFLNILIEPKDDFNCNVENDILSFKQDEYEIQFKLFGKITNFIINKKRYFEINLIKDDEKFWRNLLEDNNLFKNNIGVDWSRWIDEDDDADIFKNYNEIELSSSSSEEEEEESVSTTDNDILNDSSYDEKIKKEEIVSTTDNDILNKSSSDEEFGGGTGLEPEPIDDILSKDTSSDED